MNRRRVALLVASLVTFAMAAIPAAKGETVRLTITGPSLPHAVDVTSSAALAANVWSDNFFGNPAVEPDKAFPRYTVSFYVEPPRSSVRMMYVVYYVRNPKTGQGFIYLPGRGEEWYRLNVSTILRDGRDAKWHQAANDWSNAIAAALP
jgi:hypothetical protein